MSNEKKTPFGWIMRRSDHFPPKLYRFAQLLTHSNTHIYTLLLIQKCVLSHQRKFFHMTTPYLMKKILLFFSHGKWKINFHKLVKRICDMGWFSMNDTNRVILKILF